MAESPGLYGRSIRGKGRCDLRVRERICPRFNSGFIASCGYAGHLGGTDSECLWNWRAVGTSRARSYRARWLYLYCRLYFRSGRDHAVYGARSSQPVARERLDALAEELRGCGIKVDVSEDINRDTFIKWSFISAMACTGAYFDVPMGEVQHAGEVRDVFAGLSRESTEIGRRLGITFPQDQVAYNLMVVDKLDPSSTASMQKDLAHGHESEIQGILFDMIALGERLGVEMPTYQRVAGKFRK